MMFSRLGLASMRTQIFLLAVVPIFLLGSFASVHGAMRAAQARQQAWIESQSGKILLVIQQSTGTLPVTESNVIGAAQRFGLNVELADNRLPEEIDLRPPASIDEKAINIIKKKINESLKTTSSSPHIVNNTILSIRMDDVNSIYFYMNSPSGVPNISDIVYVLCISTIVVSPVLLVSLYIGHRLARPLTELAQEARRISVHETSRELFKAEGTPEVRSLRDSLNLMQLRISDMAERRMTMLRSLGHDLRTPLTRLRMRVDRLPERDLRQAMLRDVGMLASMIDETMAYLKATSVHGFSEQKRIDLSSLIQTIASDYTDIGTQVMYCGPPRLAYTCSPRDLTRAISNLVDNASRVSHSVDLALCQSDDSIHIDVCDDGPGLSDELKKQVVEPLFKADAARAVSRGGLGLGLSIARSIAESHGGSLELIDRVPHGLIASIRLPAQKNADTKLLKCQTPL